MHDAVNRFIAALAFLAILPAAASAERGPELQWGEDRWVPSLAAVAGADVQKQRATVDSTALIVSPMTTMSNGLMAGDPLRPRATGDELSVTPFVGGSLEIMTPAIPEAFRLRFFANAEVLPHFGVSRNLANEGNPQGLGPPIVPGGGALPQFSENAFTGAGSRTRSEVQPLAYGAGIGFSFPFSLFGREFRVKTSARWMRYEIDVEGRVVRALCTNGGTTCNPLQPVVPPAASREVSIRGDESKWFNALGPGLELEMDTVRLGPVGVSLFVGGSAYHVLGDRKIRFQSTAVSPPDALGGPDTYRARWQFKPNRWIFRGGLGVRFNLVGKGR